MPLGLRFVHDLDPLAFEVGGLQVWWYGVAYAAGFLGIFLWMRSGGRRASWSGEDALDLSIAFAAGVLVFGRLFVVIVYEWDHYRDRLADVIRFWEGGMASHGVLLGALLGTLVFSVWRRRSFLRVADELAVPAAFFLALGRIANFVNGRIHGTETDLPWGVRFPAEEGFRHPVTLYESLKNFVVVGILLVVARMRPRARGLLFAHFVFWYGFLRLFADAFRVYRSELLGIGKGQYFNALMAIVGLSLILWLSRRGEPGDRPESPAAGLPRPASRSRMAIKVTVFVALLILALTIPSAWSEGANPWDR